MSRLTLIGDVHGKYDQYKRIISQYESTIQVGDMGVGFFKSFYGEKKPFENPPHSHMVAGNHRFIRGNHDNPDVCYRHSQWIPDGHVEDEVMFIGGAVSVDKQHRTEGCDWWPDEELNADQLHALVQKYIEVRPRVMITHEAPEEIAIFLCYLSGRAKLDIPSRTRIAFQHMFSAHQPDLWVHGHWHIHSDQTADCTRFVCLAELETRTFEV